MPPQILSPRDDGMKAVARCKRKALSQCPSRSRGPTPTRVMRSATKKATSTPKASSPKSPPKAVTPPAKTAKAGAAKGTTAMKPSFMTVGFVVALGGIVWFLMNMDGTAPSPPPSLMNTAYDWTIGLFTN